MRAAPTGTAAASRRARIRRPARSSSKAPNRATCSWSRSRSSTINRAEAYSSSLLAPYAVDPAAIAARVDREPRRVTWQLDAARGVARLSGDGITPALELPLQPDARLRRRRAGAQGSDRDGTPGAFGGNMDYAGLNERREGDAAGQRARRAAVPRRRRTPGRARARSWAPASRRRWTSSSRSIS